MNSEIKDRIIIIDNFFKQPTLNLIKKDISNLNFSNRNFTVSEEEKNLYQRTYFNVNLNLKHFAVEEVTKKLKNLFFNIKNIKSYYFLSTKHKEATPHCDFNNLNCLIYLKGNYFVNNGTGFYDLIGGEYQLNTHVGFKENRAIIFDAKIFHSSLQFNENCGTRYAMANFIELKE